MNVLLIWCTYADPRAEHWFMNLGFKAIFYVPVASAVVWALSATKAERDATWAVGTLLGAYELDDRLGRYIFGALLGIRLERW